MAIKGGKMRTMTRLVAVGIILVSLAVFGRNVTNDEVEERSDGKIYVKGESTPFTGQVIEYIRTKKRKNVLKREDTYSEGIADGQGKEYHENGKIKSEDMMKNGKLISSREYSNTGELKYTLDRDESGNRIDRYYYEKHVLKEEKYRDSNDDGYNRKYHKNGAVSSETPFKSGKIAGLVRTYYENGKISSEATIANNAITGISKTYHENGQIESIHNVRTGEAIFYYENGNIKSKKHFMPNSGSEKNGPQTDYYKNDQIKLQESYKNGKRHGSYRTYYENGQLEEEMFWKNGNEHGTRRLFAEDGTELLKEEWTDGKITNNYGRDIRKVYSEWAPRTILEDHEYKDGKLIKIIK